MKKEIKRGREKELEDTESMRNVVLFKGIFKCVCVYVCDAEEEGL